MILYHNDYLGTPLKMTDSSGTVVWAADYKPFGEAVVYVNTVQNNMRFPGQYFDAETGLHYNYHRYYDPSIGRYLTPDPIGLAGGINLYAYTANNPINYTDPLGLVAGVDDLGIAIIAGGALIVGSAYYATLPPEQKQAMANKVWRIWNRYWNENTEDEEDGGQCSGGEDTQSRPPTGSIPIDQTPWSGDHQGIKGEVGAGPSDNVVISPDGHVWVENPDGSFTDFGPAGDYTGSGKPSGRKGKDRKRWR